MTEARIAIVIAVVSAAAAVGTMLIAAVQVKDAREFARIANDSTLVVDVDTESGRKKRGIIVRNAGPGVAHIKAVTYYVDGQIIESIKESFSRVTNLDAHRLEEITIVPDTFSAGERQQILRFDAGKAEQDSAEDFFEERLNVAVKYCTVGNRCETVCSNPARCADPTAAVKKSQ